MNKKLIYTLWIFLILGGIGIPVSGIIYDIVYFKTTGSLGILTILGMLYILYEVVPVVVKNPPWKCKYGKDTPNNIDGTPA